MNAIIERVYDVMKSPLFAAVVIVIFILVLAIGHARADTVFVTTQQQNGTKVCGPTSFLDGDAIIVLDEKSCVTVIKAPAPVVPSTVTNDFSIPTGVTLAPPPRKHH